jgi:hypothetical protein
MVDENDEQIVLKGNHRDVLAWSPQALPNERPPRTRCGAGTHSPEVNVSLVPPKVVRDAKVQWAQSTSRRRLDISGTIAKLHPHRPYDAILK